MDFFEINAFLALSETLHFARAARKVNLSPSALSRLISRLEEELKSELFERDNRQVTLTPAGARFLQFAKEVKQKHDDLAFDFEQDGGGLSGVLRVYASVTACYSILPPFVETLHLKYPNLRLSVETGDPASAIDSVRLGEVDLALAALPDKNLLGLESYEVMQTPLVFVGLESKQGTNHKSLTDFIGSEILLLPKNGIARERFEKYTKKHRLDYRIGAEAQGNEALFALARLGLGLALVPRIVFENGPFSEGLRIFDSGEALGAYKIGFVQKTVPPSQSFSYKLAHAVRELIADAYRT